MREAFFASDARFKVGPAGRRSGKSELTKREGVLDASEDTRFPDLLYVFAAPTTKQAKKIFWNDLKALVRGLDPRLIHKINESDLAIYLRTGTEICVVGLDAPARIEGRPIDWICIDEMGSVKPGVWDVNIRPALSTLGRPGKAVIIGVPRGRNHYYKLYQKAVLLSETSPKEWAAFTWSAEDILDPAEIQSAKDSLDELTYNQEYRASFLNFSGRAYYAFGVWNVESVTYDPTLPLIFTFDFNAAPGTASVWQEQFYKGSKPEVDRSEPVSMKLKEVWIPQNSNTPMVCRKLLSMFGDHPGFVYCYGDATGGAKGSAKVEGSDWDLIRDTLRPVYGARLKMRVPDGNPRERPRINSVNCRLKSVSGVVRTLIDPSCVQSIMDFEGVTVIEGSDGELDKDADPDRTHLSDGDGYYIHYKHPMRSAVTEVTEDE